MEEVRVPVFKNKIPFACIKYRSVDDMFNNHVKAVMYNTQDLFNQEEIANIIHFYRRIGMDLGELDVIRDKDNGRLYIVDANNTSSGPPEHMTKKEYWLAIQKLAQSFEEVFMKGNLH